jgi:phage head maturation protease
MRHLAIAKFPHPGISAESDQMAAAIRAGLFRGASIGFVPTRWAFSTDKNRPLGIDFHEIRLLEWSCVTLPCCPPCLLIGAVGSKSAPADTKMADLRREARSLAARAREISDSISDPVPLTREQRIAEAQALRRMAMAGGK